MSHRLGNTMALEGCDRCFCGCKYWENDRCVDCGLHISTIREQDERGVHFVYPGHDIPPGFVTPTTCGTCGITWDDSVATSVTPAPAARCPFESDHEEEEVQHPNFDTGYVGAHRWHVEGSYRWTCVCGKQGSIATNNIHFVQESFARHAHEALQEAAVALLVDWMPPVDNDTLQAVIGQLREQRGDSDKANLLQLVANERSYQEEQQS